MASGRSMFSIFLLIFIASGCITGYIAHHKMHQENTLIVEEEGSLITALTHEYSLAGRLELGVAQYFYFIEK